jgi:hypothetical protein
MRIENLIDMLERLAELLQEASRLAIEIKNSLEEMEEYAGTPSDVTPDEFIPDKEFDDFYDYEFAQGDYLDEGEL